MTVISSELLILAVLYGCAGALRINPGRPALVLLSIFLFGAAWLSL